MDYQVEKRGRKGGTARAGDFYNHAVHGKWYSTLSVEKFFHNKGEMITYQMARAIFDSLRRSKCYPTSEKKGPNGRRGAPRPLIKFIPPKPVKEKLPDELACICQCSIKEYLTNFLLRRLDGEPLNSLRRIYKKSDTELSNIVQIQASGNPICFDGLYYRVAAWDIIDNKVHVIFNPFYTNNSLQN